MIEGQLDVLFKVNFLKSAIIESLQEKNCTLKVFNELNIKTKKKIYKLNACFNIR